MLKARWGEHSKNWWQQRKECDIYLQKTSAESVNNFSKEGWSSHQVSPGYWKIRGLSISDLPVENANKQ